MRSAFEPRTARPPAALRRRYAKLCDVADFEDPDLRARAREIAPGPEGEELHRKKWEFAMLALFLEDAGLLEERAQVLSVGAGHEEVLFWLANKDGRDLDFEDGSFDAVFSLSSIEHFGRPADVVRAAREIGRVLRSGGYAFVVTECFVRRHVLNSKLVQTGIRVVTLGRRCPTATLRNRMLTVFTPEELRWYIIRPSRLRLLQRLDRTMSPRSWENLIHWSGAGDLAPTTGRPFPQILLKANGSAWPSVALPLRKP